MESSLEFSPHYSDANGQGGSAFGIELPHSYIVRAESCSDLLEHIRISRFRFPRLQSLDVLHIRCRFIKESTASGGGLAWPLKEARIFALALFQPLLLLLVSHVAPYLLLIQPNCRYAISAAPEMISPVWFAFEILVGFE